VNNTLHFYRILIAESTLLCFNFTSYFCIFSLRNRPKLVHQFTKTLQLLGDEVPQTTYRGFASGSHWGTSVPQTPYFAPNPNTLATSLQPGTGIGNSKKTSNEGAEVTCLRCLGKLLQMRAAPTGKARSPTVHSPVRPTISNEDERIFQIRVS